MKKYSISSSSYPEEIPSYKTKSNNNLSFRKDFTFETQREKFKKLINPIGDHIEENIPNFVKIWPYLGAYTDGSAWYPNLNHDLETIGIAHYTILKSLHYIIKNKDDVGMNDPNQRYKNIIFHYALINDCIKQILFHIYNLKTTLDSTLKFPSKKLSKNEFIREVKKWYDDDYDMIYSNFLEYGSFSIQKFIRIIPNTDNIIKCFNVEGALKKYNIFSKEKIGKLRNVFIHNPSIDVVKKYCSNSNSWKLVVVKPVAISENRTIQSISKLEWSSLIEPKCLMEELFNEATEMLSATWGIIFKEIEMINENPNFHSIYLD